MAANRAPARPANASPIEANCPVNGGVRLAYRRVSPGTCSANVNAGQASFSQKNRRTRSRTTLARPPTAVSANRRSYRLCTRIEARAHLGQTLDRPHDRAQTTTPDTACSTRSIATPARCGRRT